MLVVKKIDPHSSTQGSEERDVAFMERLRCLAREALSWAWLTPQQRLVWAAAIELDAVPLQESDRVVVVKFGEKNIKHKEYFLNAFCF